MIYDLPKTIDFGGTAYSIRTDYRVMLDICAALTDPELNEEEKAAVCLDLFYPNLDEIPPDYWEDALERCFWFLSYGEENASQSAPKLVDWEQDFQYIVAPVNRVAGQEIRAISYDRQTNEGGLHWWTFLSYYYEIGGDCVFAQIVRIRDLLARGKKLDKQDADWYRRNRHLVVLKTQYTQEEDAVVKAWLPGKSEP